MLSWCFQSPEGRAKESPEGGHLAVRSRRKGSSRLPPGADEVIEELERILADGDFDASPRSRGLLGFIVEETLAARQDGLTQNAIATRVFHRREDFDPTVDPIVRIQAGRLRRSLERYYLLAGAGDSVRIELPRGGYVPVLRWAISSEGPTSATAAGRPPEPVDDWPTVVASVFAPATPDPELEDAAVQFLDHLAVELGRYRDVRVVLRRELRRHVKFPDLLERVVDKRGKTGLTLA
jgi:hypothetical protein